MVRRYAVSIAEVADFKSVLILKSHRPAEWQATFAIHLAANISGIRGTSAADRVSGLSGQAMPYRRVMDGDAGLGNLHQPFFANAFAKILGMSFR